MSCYGCGSPEGNEARLCAVCNAKRFTDESAFIEQIAPRLEDVPTAELTKDQKILAGVGTALLAVGLWWILAPAPPPPPPAPAAVIPAPVAEAFASCVSKRSADKPSDPAEQSAQLHEASVSCEPIKTECSKDLGSTACTALISRHSPQQ
jgi:hypothetical protein